VQDAREETGPPEVLLSEAEVQRLLLAASARAPTGVRNRALIALAYCSGLRPGELLALHRAAMDLGAGSVSVRGARARAAHVFPAATPYLETWLELRSALGLDQAEALFCTLHGEPLEPAYLRAALQRLGQRARIGKRVHAHGLRHAFAVRLAQSGVDREALARQLGHSELRSSGRALAAFGVSVAAPGGGRSLSEVVWTLQPAEADVRAVVALRGPHESGPEARPRSSPKVRVRRVLFESL